MPQTRASTDELYSLLERDVVAAGPELLGFDLVRGELRAKIVEVEAYRQDEPACHAFGKARMKNMALYARPGLAYVYFAYGNHWMLNVVANAPGEAAALLIRAARPLSGMDVMYVHRAKAHRDTDLLSGPGKLAAAFAITSDENLTDLLDSKSELHLEPGERPGAVLRGPRVGIAVGKAHDYPWRFMDADEMPWVSKPHPR